MICTNWSYIKNKAHSKSVILLVYYFRFYFIFNSVYMCISPCGPVNVVQVPGGQDLEWPNVGTGNQAADLHCQDIL